MDEHNPKDEVRLSDEAVEDLEPSEADAEDVAGGAATTRLKIHNLVADPTDLGGP
jgi:hypothetical protein